METINNILDRFSSIEFVSIFLDARPINLAILFIFIYFMAKLVLKYITKPQLELNKTLKELLDRFTMVAQSFAIQEKISDDRDEKYVDLIIQNRVESRDNFEILRSDVKDINNLLIKHNSNRCYSVKRMVDIEDDKQ